MYDENPRSWPSEYELQEWSLHTREKHRKKNCPLPLWAKMLQQNLKIPYKNYTASDYLIKKIMKALTCQTLQGEKNYIYALTFSFPFKIHHDSSTSFYFLFFNIFCLFPCKYMQHSQVLLNKDSWNEKQNLNGREGEVHIINKILFRESSYNFQQTKKKSEFVWMMGRKTIYSRYTCMCVCYIHTSYIYITSWSRCHL